MITGWVHHPSPTRGPGKANHVRSYSTAPKASPDAALPAKRMSRALSSSGLNAMAHSLHSNSSAPSPSRLSAYNDEDEAMSTIPDPRSRTLSPAEGIMSPSQHPDLSAEIATLSNKLINAINHQANLADSLNEARHELETSRERIRQLELSAENHETQLANVILVERKKGQANIAEEVKKRNIAEKAKADMEKELENLTTALFEEANKMVVAARENSQKDHDAMQKKIEQLKVQCADTESLLKSHQEQLAELKQVMNQMNEEKDEQTNTTAPPTPGLNKFDGKDAGDMIDSKNSSHEDEPVMPSYPTSFTNLLQPVLRTDLAAYDDFTTLLRLPKTPSSRVSSGSYGGLSLGLGLGGYNSASPNVLAQSPSTASNSSIGTSATMSSTPATPTTPASTTSVTSTTSTAQTPLKETRFYKRALAEDIEPTLRLDTAPGLSWLARRSVLNAMCEGTLVVEPMPAPNFNKPFMFPCSLCGESRKDVVHARTHRFRTSESESAQRYPLCRYCLGRVRSCCDFLGFLRVLKDGHWRTDDEESEKMAWEESVRLREQMFWSRMGGGVVPVNSHLAHHAPADDNPRESEELEIIKELERTGMLKPRDVTPTTEQIVDATKNVEISEDNVVMPKPRRCTISKRDDTAEGLWEAAQVDAMEPGADLDVIEKKTDILDAKDSERTAEQETETRDEKEEKSNRASTQSLTPSEPGKREEKRLSITIPQPDSS